jgi:hypothetical protein
VTEPYRGVEQLGLRRRRRTAALEARDQDLDRALRSRELELELGDALVGGLQPFVVLAPRGGTPMASPVSVWLTSSIPVCSP